MSLSRPTPARSISPRIPNLTTATRRSAGTAKRDPYTIERHPTVDGVLLIGFDGRGDPMVELRVSARLYSDRMVESMRQWMREHNADLASGPVEIVR